MSMIVCPSPLRSLFFILCWWYEYGNPQAHYTMVGENKTSSLGRYLGPIYCAIATRRPICFDEESAPHLSGFAQRSGSSKLREALQEVVSPPFGQRLYRQHPLQQVQVVLVLTIEARDISNLHLVFVPMKQPY